MSENLNITRFNKLLSDTVDDTATVNNIQFICGSSKQNNSVVCKRSDAISYYTLDEKFNPVCENNMNSDNSYYGLSPKFDANTIIHVLSQQQITNVDELLGLIKKNRTLFALHGQHKDFILVAFIKAILTMASHFSRKFKLDKAEKEKLESVISENRDIFVKGVTYDLSDNVDAKDKTVAMFELIGFVPKEMLDLLNEFNFYINRDSNIESRQNSSKNEYSLRNKGTVYYSGVMPRVNKLEYITNDASANTNQIIFTVERTTFATVDMFDNTTVDRHPFMRSYKKLLERLYDCEDLAQEHLYEENSDEQIEKINRYLLSSPNTHTIAVSAILKSNDGYWIYGKRAKSAIDSGEYYCSANGQSEFLDSNVSMYAASVLEDLPTMEYESLYRIDFEKELMRETIAEIGNVSLRSKWKYLGVSYLSINNSEKKSERINKRRMHFNVIAENQLNCELHEIADKHKKATENFENDRFIGIKIMKYESLREYIKKKVISLLDLLIGWSDFLVGAILIISVIVMGENNCDIETVINLVLTGLLFVSLMTKFINAKKQKRKLKRHNLTLISKEENFDIIKKSFRKISNKGIKFNAIGTAMFIITCQMQAKKETKKSI